MSLLGKSSVIQFGHLIRFCYRTVQWKHCLSRNSQISEVIRPVSLAFTNDHYFCENIQKIEASTIEQCLFSHFSFSSLRLAIPLFLLGLPTFSQTNPARTLSPAFFSLPAEISQPAAPGTIGTAKSPGRKKTAFVPNVRALHEAVSSMVGFQRVQSAIVPVSIGSSSVGFCSLL
jgi:hypothetical protein